jgi:hypothetical protein
VIFQNLDVSRYSGLSQMECVGSFRNRVVPVDAEKASKVEQLRHKNIYA